MYGFFDNGVATEKPRDKNDRYDCDHHNRKHAK